MNKKKQIIAIVIIVITLVISIVGATYAYFSVTVTGNDNASNIITNAGTLSLFYQDGREVIVSGVIPGWTAEKEFYVINTGTVAVDYNIVWSELLNEIQNGDLVHNISKTTYSSSESLSAGDPGVTTEVLAETAVPLTAGNILTDTLIEPGEVHIYTMTLTFLNKSTDQSVNQGKTFAGKVEVTTEYMEETNSLITYGHEYNFLGGPVYREEIEELEFVNHKNVPASATSSWDISLAQNGSILAWYEPVGTNGRYKVTIGSEGEIYANQDSSYLFAKLENINYLDLSNLNITYVWDMTNMFASAGYNSDNFTLNLGNEFDTSKVGNMRGMFCDTAGINHSNFLLTVEDKIDNSSVYGYNNYYFEESDGTKNYCNGGVA